MMAHTFAFSTRSRTCCRFLVWSAASSRTTSVILRDPASLDEFALSMRALTPFTASENDAACGPVSGATTPILIWDADTPGSSTHGFGASMCTRPANGPPGTVLPGVVGCEGDDLLLLLHAPASASTAATAAIRR